jgi:hypothetical protein
LQNVFAENLRVRCERPHFSYISRGFRGKLAR